MRFPFIPRALAATLSVLVFSSLHQSAAAEPPLAADRVVTYEAFGAVGDGVADDLPAICKAHAHANEQGLPVRSNPAATYHLGRKALTAIVQTSTDWSTSKFIIDDSQGVDDHKRPLFIVRSKLKPLSLKIGRLARGQKRIDLHPPSDCLVRVENNHRKIFIRLGLNQNDGNAQREVFILRKDGSILGDIAWNYDVVTRVTAQPVDPEPLVLRGGAFTRIVNRMVQKVGYNYWSRNIEIRRSNTEVVGISMKVTSETEVGHPYLGFLNIQDCANITLRDCELDAHKTYKTVGSAGKPVSMGSYGYHVSDVMNFHMIRCRMKDIHNSSRWGIIATNFMKNILLEDCVLSRMDVHLGVSGSFIIRRSTLGYAGLNAVGSGQLTIEDCTIHGSNLIRFREDYGSIWDGEVLVRNCRWIPPTRNAVMFRTENDGSHDFGYPCAMPRVIRIEGLFVDDSKHKDKHLGVLYFVDSIAGSRPERPFPYRLTERLEVSNLKTASGLPPRVSNNPEVAKAIKVVASPAKAAGRIPSN
ncbi:MAG: hypothetical protein CFE26_00485 [Verrucomicrobiales bacterium VVV1]|nr:MAG: hypothetical protein CFE26_00485 [Verrucomicrobiales bacterium VVV1]